ncbi:MerR family transcriptional regulator [Umezawaea sp. Da 62-37]|uniref:MerR family transcriptional regulator n=1 Tax=Umezawaea sp. Da 62-37 TaxID=3075927 RepID=UPI0028F73F50|nr:MerR family transcriptional regulator [Umezawaea sp. Da 62-37]WNV89203.1 MerR family transcriptional regulator [Umezawaea sp. Da 62-37]
MIILSDGARWSAGAVARSLGISPTTLRTWDRRYGLGPRTREEGKHRRYDDIDVARLRRMLELTGQGVAPAAAATMARSGVGPVPDFHDLIGASDRLDAPGLARLTTSLVSALGVVDAWEAVLMPFLVELGRRAEDQGGGIGVEHVATDSILQVLRQVGDPVENGRLPALLAAAPEEQHSLPLVALAAALAERGCASRNLGTRVPPAALLSAVRLLSPHVVVLWAHDREHALRVPLVEVAEVSAVLLGGPGWADLPLPEGARRPHSLREAVDDVFSVSGLSS